MTYRKGPMTMSSPEIQSEYVKSIARGYGFTNHGQYCHYLFERNQIEPTTRADLDKQFGHQTHYIWTVKGGTLASAHATLSRITPCVDRLNWTDQCRRIVAEWEAE